MNITNKKNRVTATQFASNEAIANTLRSPRFNKNISQSPSGSQEKPSAYKETGVKHSDRASDEEDMINQSMSMKQCSDMIAWMLFNAPIT